MKTQTFTKRCARRVFVFFAHTAFIKTSPFMSHRQNICYINLFYINTIWQEYSWLVVLIVPSLRCLGQLLFSSYHMFFSNFLCEYLFTWYELFSLFTSYRLLFVTSVWHIKKNKRNLQTWTYRNANVCGKPGFNLV